LGYYRKTFQLPPSCLSDSSDGTTQQQRRVFVRFDGVYMNSSVWLNGVHLGDHPYGYTTFQYEITQHILQEEEEEEEERQSSGGGGGGSGSSNVLTVRVANLGRNSRFYSGSGIYRHVWLTCVDPVHVPLWVRTYTTLYSHTT
jgi:beta-galactosidase